MREPPRVPLALLPTPFHPLPRLSDRLGVELWVKRDDLTGCALSGNKVRKLEYLIADALAQGADTLFSCGGAQSNHCRSVAIAAAQQGLACQLFLRTPDPTAPPQLTANILLDALVGATITWISPEQYKDRANIMAQASATLAHMNRRAVVIPEGGSNVLGTWGYLRAALELADDLGVLPAKDTTVIYALGSGGTGAGLVLGQALGTLKTKLAGVCVCDDRSYFAKIILELTHGALAEYGGEARIADADLDILEGYVGRGYALSTADELAVLRDAARLDGLILDPVYSGKAFYGMVKELAKNPRRFGDRIVFLHTGGIFGLFPKADELAPLLDANAAPAF